MVNSKCITIAVDLFLFSLLVISGMGHSTNDQSANCERWGVPLCRENRRSPRGTRSMRKTLNFNEGTIADNWINTKLQKDSRVGAMRNKRLLTESASRGYLFVRNLLQKLVSNSVWI